MNAYCVYWDIFKINYLNMNIEYQIQTTSGTKVLILNKFKKYS